MGICDGRVAIVTGAGRGIGREHALLLAKEGAMVVVNDLGVAPDGIGIDLTPAQQVVAEIEAMGGAAIANGDDVSSWSGAEHMVKEAVHHRGVRALSDRRHRECHLSGSAHPAHRKPDGRSERQAA